MDESLPFRSPLIDRDEADLDAEDRPGRPTFTGFLIACAVAAGIAAVGTFFLLGLPGAVLYEFTGKLILGTDPWEKFRPSGAWPLALYFSLLWPASIPAGYLLGSWAVYFTGWRVRGVLLCACVIAWNVALTLWFYQQG